MPLHIENLLHRALWPAKLLRRRGHLFGLDAESYALMGADGHRLIVLPMYTSLRISSKMMHTAHHRIALFLWPALGSNKHDNLQGYLQSIRRSRVCMPATLEHPRTWESRPRRLALPQMCHLDTKAGETEPSRPAAVSQAFQKATRWHAQFCAFCLQCQVKQSYAQCCGIRAIVMRHPRVVSPSSESATRQSILRATPQSEKKNPRSSY